MKIYLIYHEVLALVFYCFRKFRLIKISREIVLIKLVMFFGDPGLKRNVLQDFQIYKNIILTQLLKEGWQENPRNSKIDLEAATRGVLRNFAKFTGKHLC